MLSSAAWANLFPKLEIFLTKRREERGVSEPLESRWKRQLALVPRHTKLRTSDLVSLEARQTFPPPRVFVHLDSVKPFWELDRKFELKAWRAAIPSILIEIDALLASFKLCLFGKLVYAYTSALTRPNANLDPLPTFSTPPSHAEMDAFLALPTLAFQCTLCRTHGFHYSQIVQHLGACADAVKAYRLGDPRPGKNGKVVPVKLVDRIAPVKRNWVGGDVWISDTSIMAAKLLWKKVGETQPSVLANVTKMADLGVRFECLCSKFGRGEVAKRVLLNGAASQSVDGPTVVRSFALSRDPGSGLILRWSSQLNHCSEQHRNLEPMPRIKIR